MTYLAEKKSFESQHNIVDEDDYSPIHVGMGNIAQEAPPAPPEFNISEYPTVRPPSIFVDKDACDYLKFKIEFQKAQILPYKRIAPYQISDFIANCGGLLGLFMGISLLSFVEILYFCTFRFIEAVRAVRKKIELRMGLIKHKILY